MSTDTREMVWTEGGCAACGRAPYRRRDGREYLYRYRANGPVVCSPRCDATSTWTKRAVAALDRLGDRHDFDRANAIYCWLSDRQLRRAMRAA